MLTDNLQHNRTLHILFLSIVFVCSFFINNNVLLSDIMESRNLITAREMVSENNWLVPTMNGELRLEKPPLPTWIAGIVEYVSPDNIILQRCMSGLAACLLVVFVYLLACLLTQSPVYALVSALLLCTSYNIILMGRTATWDIYCHAFMMGAIYYLVKAFRLTEQRKSYFLYAGIFLGLSFLGKGPVSFYALLLPFLCSYAIVYRKGLKGKGRGIAIMVVTCLILSCWWYIYIYIFHTDVANYVFHKETSAWTNHNVRPWWYYWQFFLETGIWSLLTVTALVYPYWKKRVEYKSSYLFSLLWIVFMLFFLSLLPEKKTRYLLPILIPCALMMGHILLYWMTCVKNMKRGDKIVFRINTILILIAVLVLPVAAYLFLFSKGDMGVTMFIVTIIGCLLFAFWMIRSIRKTEAFSFLLAVTALFMFIEILFMPYLRDIVHNKDFNSISAVREMPALKDLQFYTPGKESMRIEMVFEAYRTILNLDTDDKNTVINRLPFVLVSHYPAEEILPAGWEEEMEIELIGVYDNNRWPKNHRRYTSGFINHVTVVKKK